MTTLRFLLNTCVNAILWAVLFLACRFAVWGMDGPAWWTIPLALGLGFAWLAGSRLRGVVRDLRGERTAVAGENANPQQLARMRRAWKQGRGLRHAGLFQPVPIWYLCLEQAPTRSGGMLDTVDAADRQSPAGDEEFSWGRGPNALWLDFPDAWAEGDDYRWNAFLRLLKTHDAPLAGIAMTVEADHLLLDDPAGLRKSAALLRHRLERLRLLRRETVPVYLVVNRLDCLYGMRSLVTELGRERLGRPLGAVRRERESAEDLARRVVDACGADLTRLPPRHEAAVQAPAELERLRGPLAHFCSQLFAGADSPLRGIYLASSAPGGGTIPPLMVELPTFRELREDPLAGESWFLRSLLREGIPGDVHAARRAVGGGRRRLSPGLTGLAAGSLVLCSLLTWSFLENQAVLLSARGRAAPPESADSLGPFLDLAEQTRLRAGSWRLPRFGMVEADLLADELQRRYTESYFDLKTVPGVEYIQEAALASVRSGDPREIGNSLLLLAATRAGLSRNLDGAGEAPASERFLHELVGDLRLAGPEDVRQFETYFDWAGAQEWMPETRDALAAFERHILDNARGGDLSSWLPSWIESLPGLDGVDAERVWEPVPVPPIRVGGAWTAKGYRIARGLLEAVVPESDRREAFLAEYRRSAVRHWRQAADRLWNSFQRRIRDDDLPELVRAASRLDDPASRFVALLQTHLLPMHDDANDGTGGAADAEWLLLHGDDGAVRKVEGEDGLVPHINRTIRFLGSDDGMSRLSRRLGFGGGDRRGP
ncbi:MAG: hypothetical protein LBS30_02830, partial [Planctomycetota bacterium]|nr:hypothetical protein [Planctomycetota bacterium]